MNGPKLIVYVVTIDRVVRPRRATRLVMASDLAAAAVAAVEDEPNGTRAVRIKEIGTLDALDSRFEISFSSEL